ncbi:transcriptional regulator [Hydrogenovibrio sp. SC-1]|uniref:AbrB/MazE/SpoVT family DNA-binding domain-containing protein n=1 Tax=Hydrogenovibrio sp. SC-1 TaxID=2065820 RepID=UPI000C7B767A|nr:transcriptional regulator [Hydrogenovibrio sp. SC-1]PLA74949.1 transcriptional regulator [Hydrogenovibrio sp. SC-1]
MSLKIDAKIQKWGSGLGLKISGPMKDIPHFLENTPVTVEVFEDGFTIKKVTPPIAINLPYSEEQLLEGLNPYNCHADLLATPLDSELGE